MAEFPIKMLKDEEGKPFVPVVSAKTIILTSGYDLDTELNKKLEQDNIIAGRNVTVERASDSNNVTIGGPAIMNNVTTDAGGKGVLDAYQGKVLNDKIVALDNIVQNNKSNTDKEINDLKTRATNLENNKVDKKEGYGLSKNDFTDALLNKLNGIEAGAQVNTVLGVKGEAEDKYRIGNINITKANIGLSDVENKSSATIRSELTTENVTNALGYVPMDSALKGVPNGVAELDKDGHVPASQLPSYVDDVLEFDSEKNFPRPGESGKIYVDTSTNLSYRWSGTTYVTIASDLALGETADTAYRGDRGAMAYEHAVANRGSEFASGFYKIATNNEGHVTGAIPVLKSDIMDLGIPGSDTTYNDATKDSHGLMSAADKRKLDGLANVATTASYNDLIDTPYIPENLSDLDNDLGYLLEEEDPTVPGHVKAITIDDINNWNNKSEFDGDYESLTNKPFIPENTSELNNDAGFLTSFTETDPTVPKWAKQPEKPTYTYEEVGALSEDTFIPSKTSDIENDSGFINDVQLGEALLGKQDKLTAGAHISIENNIISAEGATKLSELENDTNFITKSVNNLDNYLSKTNTTSYTPSANYHPATKKYVDDTIATSVPNLPDNLTTFDNRYSDEQVRLVVSETKPQLAEGYIDLWINPKYISSYDKLAEKDWVDEQIENASRGYVHLENDELISGIKSFNSIPMLPSSNPTLDDQATRKGYVDAQIKANKFSGSYTDLSGAPTTVSAFSNDAGYIKNSVTNLTNYYDKSTIDTKVNTLTEHVDNTNVHVTVNDKTNWNNKSNFDGKYSSLTGAPTTISSFTNDAGFIKNTVDNLTNYYKKTETYTQTEINNLISAVNTLKIEVITSFPSNPSTTTIYLKAKTTAETENAYDEYIYINSKWEKIGDTKVDLSNYYNKSEIDTKVNSKANSSDLTSHTGDTTVHVTSAEKTKWNAKSDFSGSYTDLTNKPTIPTSSDYVALTGAQTIAGIKTFSSIPVGPASDPTSNNQLTRKAYVDAQITALQTAITNLQNSLKPADYVSKIQCDYGTLNANYNYFYKIGDLVIFNISYDITRGISANTQIDFATIPAEVTPKGNVIVNAFSHTRGYCTVNYIRSNSKIVLVFPFAVPSGEVNITGCYYIK